MTVALVAAGALWGGWLGQREGAHAGVGVGWLGLIAGIVLGAATGFGTGHLATAYAASVIAALGFGTALVVVRW